MAVALIDGEGIFVVRLFLDTDFGPDCDDVGALQLAHYLCDVGEAELIGVTHCTGNPYGLPAISALNRYNGREMPLGTCLRPFLSEHQKYNRELSEKFPHEFQDGRPQRAAVEVFREVLCAQPDRSVTVCSIGPLNNLADFLADQECRALIDRKVVRLVAMAGRFDGSGEAEWNVLMDVSAMRKVMREWPSEIVLCPFECGANVLTGGSLRGIENHPVETAYRLHSGGIRQSWDLLTVYYAVRPEDGMMKRSAWGMVDVLDGGETTFRETSDGSQAYLINVSSDEEMAERLDEMLCARKTPARR